MPLFHHRPLPVRSRSGAARQVICILGLCALAGPVVAQSPPRYISTLVGNGVAGMNGDGLPPLKTALYLPQDGTFGPDGNFYFVDWNNHRIRRIRNGIIETVAGSGYIGDGADGPALTMPLNHPTHISFDKQGRLLIAAWHNSKVKRIDFTTGLAVNLAGTGARAYGGDGGPANAARMDLPSSVVEDSKGNLCISDQANFRIRMVGLDGNINTFCGTGIAGYTGDNGPAAEATLRSPVGQSAPPAGRIDIDAQDRLYIADTGNHVIRMIDTDGKIRTIAGTGVPGFSGDNGPATQAQLNVPSDVAVAPDGTIYIADTKNNRVRRVAPDGIITTFAGTGSQGFSGDGGLSVNAKLNRPYGVAVAPTGEIMIADTHNQRVRIVTSDPVEIPPEEEAPPIVIVPCTDTVGSICTWAGTGFQGFTGDGHDRQRSALDQPIDVEFTPSGRVYVLDWNNHKVRQVMPDQTFLTVMGSDFVGDGPLDLSDLTAPGAPGVTVDLNHPTDMQEMPNGDLMVMAWHNHKIRMLYPDTGLVRVLAGLGVGFVDNAPAKNARLNQPPHAVLDPSGNLFFIDQRNQRIRMITNFADQRENAMVSTIAGTGTPGFNGDGPALTTQFSFPTGTNPEPSGGIARAADGTLYFADTWNHRLRKITFTGDFTTGAVTTIAGTGQAGDSGDGGPALSAQINNPLDLELGPDGKLYFADTNNNRIRRIDLASGTIEAVAGTGSRGYSGDGGQALQATFDRPFGVAFDHFGNLYISDTFNSRIRKVKLTTTPEGPESIVPADYAATYQEVRDCRFSLEHGGVYIRVLASPEAAQAYQENANPLPVGTVIVKEEYSDGECEADELLRWRAMRKEAPGFDTADGNWHWQYLTPRREVVYDDKSTCISCHQQQDCLNRDYMCTVPGSKGMKVVLDNLPATLVSVSGLPPDDGHSHGVSINFDVFAVGADPGDGRGPFIVRFDHEEGAWRRLHSGAAGDLWWVSDRPIEGDMYMCGENGLILRYNLAAGTFEKMKTPGGKLLFGVWGTNRQNLWAVGGDLSNEETGGAVWRWSGTEWVVDNLAPNARPEGLPTLYKVWGRASDDVYAVGRLGVALHWNGVNWVSIPTGTTRQLFTVHGNDTRVVATGGAFTGLILELEGNSFVDRTPAGAPQMNGVFVSIGPASAVGAEGNYAILGAGGWELQPPVAATKPMDFHGTWMDSSGGVWAVGGDLTVDKSYGVLGYSGQALISPNFISDTLCATGTATGPVGTVSYLRDVLPIFNKTGCMGSTCHGGGVPESQYSQRTYQGTFGPGQQARNYGMCDVVPGNPRASFLLEKLGENPRAGVQMPNGLPPLTAEQIAVVRAWIEQGAVEDAPLSRTFTRGDPDANGARELTDAVAVLSRLFLGGAELACEKSGDTDDNGTLEITDPIALLNHLFLGGPVSLPAPFPGCGVDTTRDNLSCSDSGCP